jgi:divalent metal cation (Fe/Co/Zn/Cd) transporter
MDAVDPGLVDQVDEILRSTQGVESIGTTRIRWIGHQLRAECTVVVSEDLTVTEGHRIAEECEHRLLHDVPRLTAALVHADVVGGNHELTAHHERSH